MAEIKTPAWRILDPFQNNCCSIFLLENVLCWTLRTKQQPRLEGPRCFSGMIKSESLCLKAQCICGEVGMLINVFGTTPPFSVSTEKKNKMAPQIKLHRAYIVSSEILRSLDFSLPTGAGLHRGAVGCDADNLSDYLCIVSFIETAAQVSCKVL